MVLTPDRLLILAVAVSVLAADGIRRALQQRRDETLGRTPFRLFVGVLGLGAALAWLGYALMLVRT